MGCGSGAPAAWRISFPHLSPHPPTPSPQLVLGVLLGVLLQRSRRNAPAVDKNFALGAFGGGGAAYAGDSGALHRSLKLLHLETGGVGAFAGIVPDHGVFSPAGSDAPSPVVRVRRMDLVALDSAAAARGGAAAESYGTFHVVELGADAEEGSLPGASSDAHAGSGTKLVV